MSAPRPSKAEPLLGHPKYRKARVPGDVRQDPCLLAAVLAVSSATLKPTPEGEWQP
jgi:hypothetical protein